MRSVDAKPATQYETDANLRARQILWEISPREPPFVLFPWVLNLADIRDGDRVLEVGCGNGGYLELADAVGLDASIGMVRTARERARGPVLCGDVQQLPFADAAFDIVLAPHMLYHVADRAVAARELRRVLKADGRCVAVTNGARCHHELVDLIEGVVGHGWRLKRPADVNFSLENGGDQLRAGFGRVERVDAPFGVVSVRDAAAFGDYVASMGDHYEAEIAQWTTWDAVVAECRERVAQVIATNGRFDISSVVGAFVCRP
jgi:SAM-dependent methyltransferase